MTSDRLHDSSSAMFEKNWRMYRTVMANNLMYHREVYHELHRVLVDEAPRPFRFLDIACGDASCTVEALKGTAVSDYRGIDLSQPALDLARALLGSLGCPFKLENRDFVEAVTNWSDPADVVWIGQSLHHLLMPQKRILMQKIRGIVGAHGLFLIWEPTRLDSESKDGWDDRFGAIRPSWSALSDEDFAEMYEHIKTSDHPETVAAWRTMGAESGFSHMDELFRAPNDLARMYLFRN